MLLKKLYIKNNIILKRTKKNIHYNSTCNNCNYFIDGDCRFILAITCFDIKYGGSENYKYVNPIIKKHAPKEIICKK